MQENAEISTLLQQYLPALDSFNELFDLPGHIRPDWKIILSSLLNLPNNEIGTRSQHILRLLKENGVAYHVYDETNGQNRPW
jgi:uncharacterized circularly permuted ATP-grasp superfamily protein